MRRKRPQRNVDNYFGSSADKLRSSSEIDIKDTHFATLNLASYANLFCFEGFFFIFLMLSGWNGIFHKLAAFEFNYEFHCHLNNCHELLNRIE